MGETDSGSPFNSSWKLGALIGLYTTRCRHCSTWIQLQSLLGKLKASLGSTGFSGSPPWPFALSAVFPSYQRAALHKLLFPPGHVLLDCIYW